ncbi:uncharacterized protein TNCV_1426511 [Trichonephila clavipes]|nr:uncharacterized protein TNCV_1426511 [Trichonephila clavipes]
MLLGRQIAGRNYPPTKKNTLIRSLTEEWDKLPQQLLDNVVQSTALRYPPVVAVAEWSRYQIVAGLATSSSPVPLKTCRVGQRCTLNLSRPQMSSRWCDVVVGRGVPAQVSSTSLDHGSELCGPSPKGFM